MKKRKFTKLNFEKGQLREEVKWLKSRLKDLKKENLYLQKRNNILHEPTREEIYYICNSYESGFGHGAANDGLDLSKTPHSEQHLGVAYQIGYEAGQSRRNGDN